MSKRRKGTTMTQTTNEAPDLSADSAAVDETLVDESTEVTTSADTAPITQDEPVEELPVIEAATSAAVVLEAALQELPEAAVITPVIETIVEAVPAAEPVKAPTPAFNTTGLVLSEQSLQLLERLRLEAPLQVAVPFHQLLTYMHAMQPGLPVQPPAGARLQVSLYRILQNVIKNSGDHFQLAFSTLLRIVLDNDTPDGVMGDRYVFRFTDLISLPINDQHGFRHLVNLLKVAAPVVGRAERIKKTVNVAVATQYNLDDESRRRVLDYLGV